jgi:carbon-monoxide dehydrogenase large subunit
VIRLANKEALPQLLPPKHVGTRVKRKEDARLTSGRGRYVGDMKLAGMLHAVALRSPYAHARIDRIDASSALALDGVVAFFSAADIRGKVGIFPEPAFRELNPDAKEFLKLDIKSHPMEPLPTERVLWVGQPVGYLVAEDRYVAEDALALVHVDYEPLPVAASVAAALADGAPILHPELGDNIQQTYRVATGDVEEALINADHRFRVNLSMGRQVANSIETRGMLADYDASREELVVWSTTTRPHMQRAIISEMLNIPVDSVRCIGPDIGGSFGSGIFHEWTMIPFLARELQRPVRWIEDRRENLQNTRHSRDQIHDVEVGFNTDGSIIGLRDDFKIDFGAHNNFAITISYNVATLLRGPYKIENYSISCTGVLTNKAPCTPVRGAGRPECTYVMERVIEMVADELEMDPVEVRKKNLIRPEEMPYDVGIPYRDGTPLIYDRGDFPDQLQRALDLVELDEWRKRQSEAREDGRHIGIGISSTLESSGGGPYESALVRIDQSGGVTVYTGAQPHGQGLETTLAQVAADQLGVTPSDVTVRPTDTGTIAFGGGTFGSRSAVTAGNAVAIASAQLREKLLAVAAQSLEVSPGDLELIDGQARVRGTPNRSMSLKEIARAAAPGVQSKVPEDQGPGLEIQYFFVPPAVTFGSGTQVAVVEVDEETGFVSLLDYASVDDCGRMLNPMVVEGQIRGGIAHGIGNAMLEEAMYDEDGQYLSSTYMDYLLPTTAEVPPIKIGHQEHLSERNPLGVKGAGESGAVCPPPAIANAIVDAFRPLRLTIDHAPVSPESVLDAIRAAKQMARPIQRGD